MTPEKTRRRAIRTALVVVYFALGGSILPGAAAAAVTELLELRSTATPLWIMSEPLFVLFLTLGLAALARASRRAAWPTAALGGIAFGLAALVRSGPVAFVPPAAALLVAARGA